MRDEGTTDPEVSLDTERAVDVVSTGSETHLSRRGVTGASDREDPFIVSNLRISGYGLTVPVPYPLVLLSPF